MKSLVSFFRKRNDSCDCDVKAAMIKAAFNGDWVCDEIVEAIRSQDATDHNVPAILFGLTRATASFLKSLEKSDIHAKRLFDGMLNVWLEMLTTTIVLMNGLRTLGITDLESSKISRQSCWFPKGPAGLRSEQRKEQSSRVH